MATNKKTTIEFRTIGKNSKFSDNNNGVVVWLTGLPSSKKTTIAHILKDRLASCGYLSYILDGDKLRRGLNKNLTFSRNDRRENLRRAAEVAKLFIDAGFIILAAFVSPFKADREMVRDIIGCNNFIEVFLSCPANICEQRDPKGNYAKAHLGLLPKFTGISSPYEKPEHPDLIIDTSVTSPENAAKNITDFLHKTGTLKQNPFASTYLSNSLAINST